MRKVQTNLLFQRKAPVLFSFYQPKIEMSGLFILEGNNSGTMTLGFLILINLVFEDNKIDGTF